MKRIMMPSGISSSNTWGATDYGLGEPLRGYYIEGDNVDATCESLTAIAQKYDPRFSAKWHASALGARPYRFYGIQIECGEVAQVMYQWSDTYPRFDLWIEQLAPRLSRVVEVFERNTRLYGDIR